MQWLGTLQVRGTFSLWLVRVPQDAERRGRVVQIGLFL